MLNELSKKIHENAKAHGWWEEPKSFGEIVALCHSELSEALEEYRNKMPALYCKNDVSYGGNKCSLAGQGFCSNFNGDCKNEKPEGVAVELADVVIRILDYFGTHPKIDIDGWVAKTDVSGLKFDNFPEFITGQHALLTYASFGTEGLQVAPFQTAKWYNYFALVIASIRAYFWHAELNFYEILEIKHKYNKSRPYKHGGKRI